MLAFLSSSSATKRSLAEASGSSRMLRSCARWPGAQQVGDVVHRLGGQQGERLGLDLKKRVAALPRTVETPSVVSSR